LRAQAEQAHAFLDDRGDLTVLDDARLGAFTLAHARVARLEHAAAPKRRD
jgi:hypothetical protein